MKGQILELSFLKDQGLLRDGTGCGIVGAPLTGPHWTSGGTKKGVSFNPGTTMSVQVKIQVSPANTVFKLFGISKKQPALNFEFGPLLAGPSPQLVTLRSKAPLPAQLSKMNEYITWNIVPVNGKQEWVNIGQTGEHSIYITFGAPMLKNSMGYQNAMTVPRLDLIYNAISPADKVSDPASLAAIIQSTVNGLAGIGSGRPNINYAVAESVDRLWSLADANTAAHGHCGEASYLMEQALRMIGVPALQKHVYARTDRASLDAGQNVVFEDETTHKTVGLDVNPQKRTCKKHGEEALRLFFGRVNFGEGTVEVGGKLYGGLVNEIGEAHGGITAAHDILLKLQAPRKTFQVWNSDEHGRCTLGPGESGAGIAEPPVPAA